LVDAKAQQAEIRALRNNSGLNFENTLRGKLENVVTDPRLNRGWIPPEIAQAREVVAGTWPQNIMRWGSNFTGGGGGAGAMLSSMAGGAVGPVGHALPAVSLAANCWEIGWRGKVGPYRKHCGPALHWRRIAGCRA
jgi:hypothetical protein